LIFSANDPTTPEHLRQRLQNEEETHATIGQRFDLLTPFKASWVRVVDNHQRVVDWAKRVGLRIRLKVASERTCRNLLTQEMASETVYP